MHILNGLQHDMTALASFPGSTHKLFITPCIKKSVTKARGAEPGNKTKTALCSIILASFPGSKAGQ